MNEDLVISKIINLEADMKIVKEKVGILETSMNTLMKGQDPMIKVLQMFVRNKFLVQKELG